MQRSDQIAWLLFLVVLGGSTVFLLLATSLALLE
jgi:hypothetical protein